MEKSHTATKEDIKAFKEKTNSQFQKVEDVFQCQGFSLNSNSTGHQKPNPITQQLSEIRQQIKDLQQLINSESAQENQNQNIQHMINTSQTIRSFQQQKAILESNIRRLNNQLNQMQQTLATRSQSQTSDLNQFIEKQNEKFQQLQQNVNNVEKIIQNSKVEEFKTILDKTIDKNIEDMTELKRKVLLKADVSDLMKLEEMLLNMMEHMHQNNLNIFANKSETKKAFMFIQKRINSMLTALIGQTQAERQAIVTSKQLKCISCTKDFGQIQGKLDKYKSWQIFPVKQSAMKEKYAGFGSGFQSILQTSINKKGGQTIQYEKGKMTAPCNPTNSAQTSSSKITVPGSSSGVKSQKKLPTLQDSAETFHNKNYNGRTTSSSTTKNKYGMSPSINTNSPVKSSLKYETHLMTQFGQEPKRGTGGESFNIRQQYIERERGLQNTTGNKYKLISQQQKKQQQK